MPARPGWRNRQTRGPQKPQSFGACGFESRSGHLGRHAHGTTVPRIRPATAPAHNSVGPHDRRAGRQSCWGSQKCMYSGMKFWSGLRGMTPFSLTENSAVAVVFGSQMTGSCLAA